MMRLRAAISAVVFLFCAGWTAKANYYWVIVKGKVTMEDGSPPPFIVSVERVCSDLYGDAPGPLTNKKGEWLWRLNIDPYASRACIFRASHPGYTSTTDNASALNVTSRDTTLTVDPLVLSPITADPYAIRVTGDKMSSKAKGPFEKAMKDIDARNYQDAASQLAASVAASPKFAEGWHALGLVDEKLDKATDAREAYTHAIEADPKLLRAYVTLARICLKTKDWQCAANASDSLIKLDPKRTYPEIYLHQAAARYELKDLAGAEQSVMQAIQLDPKHKQPREEYVAGRILEAKGDLDAARQHISKYLDLDPNAPDAALIRAQLMELGKPQPGVQEPDLEVL